LAFSGYRGRKFTSFEKKEITIQKANYVKEFDTGSRDGKI
jgi:hypothetical protein